MKRIKWLNKDNLASPLETLLLGIFSIFFVAWIISVLPSFGENTPYVILTCGALGVWFIFTEYLKATIQFQKKRLKALLLTADTFIFGGLFVVLVYFFSHDSQLSQQINFFLYLPAISIPLYYDYLPGLLSLSTVYLMYFVVLNFANMTAVNETVLILQILSYLLVYSLLSSVIRQREKANNELKRALEKVENLDKAKDSFIATAAHELKSPITVISGFLGMIKFDNLKEKEREDAINRAYESSTELATLVKRLLDFNRIQMNKLTLNLDSFQMAELCQEIIDNYSKTNKNSQVKYICEAKVKECNIYADKELIKEVLVNLINNAAKFTEKGEIRLTLEENPKEIFVSVRDSGQGISKNELNNIFHKFYQTKDGQANHLGLGLGLNLSKEIIKAHKGRIWVESKLGKGTTFTFSLPK